MSDQQTPSIGRIVHQEHPLHGCLAAIIVEVTGSDRLGRDEVNLYRFPHPNCADGLLFRVPQGEPGEAETWHWPERV